MKQLEFFKYQKLFSTGIDKRHIDRHSDKNVFLVVITCWGGLFLLELDPSNKFYAMSSFNQTTHLPRKTQLALMITLLVLLVMGGLAAGYLAQTDQDIRQQAMVTTYIDPTPTPSAALTPTPTPTLPPTDIKCDWCGNECLTVDPARSCGPNNPPKGYVCMKTLDTPTSCVAKAIECVPKPDCAFSQPACEIDLKPYQVLCADSDLNHDMMVDDKDFGLLSMHFFDSSPADLAVDINRDGKVDIIDYSIMVKEWTR